MFTNYLEWLIYELRGCLKIRKGIIFDYVFLTGVGDSRI
jgi:hypothetical protein